MLKNIRWSRLCTLFGSKKNTSSFVAIKSGFVFNSIVTTNIQKTLEHSRRNGGIPLDYKV